MTKIFENTLTFFANEPNSLSDLPTSGVLRLDFDLGTYITSNVKDIHFYVGTDSKGLQFYIYIYLSH